MVAYSGASEIETQENDGTLVACSALGGIRALENGPARQLPELVSSWHVCPPSGGAACLSAAKRFGISAAQIRGLKESDQTVQRRGELRRVVSLPEICQDQL